MHVLLVFFCWPRASWRFFGPQCVKARFLHVITWRSVELNRKVTYNCLAWFSGIKDYDPKYAQTRVSSKKDAVKVLSTESLYSLVSYNCTRLSVYHWLFDGHEQWSSLVRFNIFSFDDGILIKHTQGKTKTQAGLHWIHIPHGAYSWWVKPESPRHQL